MQNHTPRPSSSAMSYVGGWCRLAVIVSALATPLVFGACLNKKSGGDDGPAPNNAPRQAAVQHVLVVAFKNAQGQPELSAGKARDIVNSSPMEPPAGITPELHSVIQSAPAVPIVDACLWYIRAFTQFHQLWTSLGGPNADAAWNALLAESMVLFVSDDAPGTGYWPMASRCDASVKAADDKLYGWIDHTRVWSVSFQHLRDHGLLDKVPATPAGFTATGVSSSAIDLAWKDVSDETEYRIYFDSGIRGVIPQQFQLLATLRADVTSFRHDGLAPSTTVKYKLVAVNSQGESQGAEAMGTTLAVGACPAGSEQATVKTYTSKCNAGKCEAVEASSTDVGCVTSDAKKRIDAGNEAARVAAIKDCEAKQACGPVDVCSDPTSEACKKERCEKSGGTWSSGRCYYNWWFRNVGD